MASSSAPPSQHNQASSDDSASAQPLAPPPAPSTPTSALDQVIDDEPTPSLQAHPSTIDSDHDDHDHDHDHDDHHSDLTDDHNASDNHKHQDSPHSDPQSQPSVETSVDAFCVVCFEREPNVTLDPCGHSNLCDICVSRLVKRRCPTCRARARKVTIRDGDQTVTKAVREVIAERKQRETRVLEETLQIVFLGPEKVGKKTLVRKLMAKYPLVNTNTTQSSPPDDEEPDPTNSNNPSATAPATAATAITSSTTSTTSTSTSQCATTSAAPTTATANSAAAASPTAPVDPPDVFSDGTDFSPNATIGGANVRLTVLRRTTLASRRMVLDDVRVLKPDVLVLCCSAHVGATFDTILAWDKVLRNNFQKPRVWALLTLENDRASTATFDAPQDVSGAINAIFPADLRPKGHYFCSLDETFSVGFRSLAKEIVSMGRIARDEELAASIAMEEARTLADQEAAGTLGDHVAANLVIANNGITMPASSSTNANAARPTTGGRAGGGHPGRGFSLRALRERGGNGQGISLSGLVSWLAGSTHES